MDASHGAVDDDAPVSHELANNGSTAYQLLHEMHAKSVHSGGATGAASINHIAHRCLVPLDVGNLPMNGHISILTLTGTPRLQQVCSV